MENKDIQERIEEMRKQISQVKKLPLMMKAGAAEQVIENLFYSVELLADENAKIKAVLIGEGLL
jgi:predicted transcriptional regulator